MRIPFPDTLCPPFEHAYLDLVLALSTVQGQTVGVEMDGCLATQVVFQIPGETPVFIPTVFWSPSMGWCGTEYVWFTGDERDHQRLVQMPGEPGEGIVATVARAVSSYESFVDPASASVVSGSVASALAAFVREHVRDPASLLDALFVMES